MARKNAQEAYQRVQEAKAKSRARSGGAKAVISPPPPPPPPRNVGTPSQPIVISSSSLSRPPPSAQILSDPEKKRRKTSESGSSLDVRVIAPDLDLSPLHPDKVVIDGAIVDPPVPEVVSESDLKTRGQRIIESPPRSKNAPGSSSVPPTGPGGAPPESGGGDLSTPLKR
nr:proline-rich receptor-like protein kinase PERK9 [Arachis hypogaea]